MDDSPFGRLSPELRNEVYELCLTQPSAIRIFPRWGVMLFGNRDYDGPLDTTIEGDILGGRAPSETPLPRHAFALAKTCKDIRNECGKLMYSCNTFSVKLFQMDRKRGGPNAALWNGEKPDANRDATLNTGSEARRNVTVKQLLGPWRLFNAMIGPANASVLRSVVLGLELRYPVGRDATRIGGLLVTLANEVATLQDLRMTVNMYMYVWDHLDLLNIKVELGRGTICGSLRNQAEVLERKTAEAPGERSKSEFRRLARYLTAFERAVSASERGARMQSSIDKTDNQAR
ncbi:hypothetical protein LTR08_002612 [Meristemomyces frigidus]|nr:hypothetical protein LTR08_002612 [Meristemomyces frigidus]